MAERIGFTTGTSLQGLRRKSRKVPKVNRMSLFAKRALQFLWERL